LKVLFRVGRILNLKFIMKAQMEMLIFNLGFYCTFIFYLSSSMEAIQLSFNIILRQRCTGQSIYYAQTSTAFMDSYITGILKKI